MLLQFNLKKRRSLHHYLCFVIKISNNEKKSKIFQNSESQRLSLPLLLFSFLCEFSENIYLITEKKMFPKKYFQYYYYYYFISLLYFLQIKFKKKRRKTHTCCLSDKFYENRK